MEKYKVMLNDWRHYDKNKLKQWAAAIKNRILNHPRELTVEELATYLINGHTTILGHLAYAEEDKNKESVSASSKHWVSQQVFAVDVDNEISIIDKTNNRKKTKVKTVGDKYITYQKALDICTSKGAPPAFIYTTYSHEEDHHKYRVLFVLDKEITSIDERKKVVASLLELFTVDKECCADTKCVDPSRLFYPGKELVYKAYDSKVSCDHLINNIIPSYCSNKANRSSDKIKKDLKDIPHDKEKQYEKEYCSDNQIAESSNFKCSDRAEKKGPVSKEVPSTHCNNSITGGSNRVHKRALDLNTQELFTTFIKHSSKPLFVRHPEDYYKLARSIPLENLFGKGIYENFNCILPDHNDNNASSRIEIKNGTEDQHYYHCYGCMPENKYYDIFNILEHVKGWNHLQSKKFVNNILNVEFETEWQIEKKKDISEYCDFIYSPHFAERFPFMYSELKKSNSIGILFFMLMEAKRLIYDKSVTETECAIFYSPITRIQQILKDMNIVGTSIYSIHRKIKYLAKLGLIRIINDEELSDNFRKEASRRKAENEYRYRKSYFSIPTFSFCFLEKAEDLAKEYKEKHMKRRDYSRQMELWTEGKESADSIFVQDTEVLKSPETIDFYEKSKEVINSLMRKNGYTTKKEVLNHHKIRYIKNKSGLIIIVMHSLLNENNLKLVKYSKDHQEKLNIKQKDLYFGRSSIIIKEYNI